MIRLRAWLAIVLFTGLAIAAAPASAGRYADIVVDVSSGKVLHAEDADGLRYPASLTKIMTLYLTFDALKTGRFQINDALPVSAFAAGQSPSIIGLTPGKVISVEEAIYAVAIKSANDAAVVLAEALAGSEPAFGQMMTNKARQLGMRNTTFRNASGLPNPGQKTTARDMATLALALLRDHPNRYHYFATESFYFDGRVVPSHNRLNSWYDGADGIKTGFINASGFNLVTSAKRDGRRLVGVVFGGTTASARDRRMAELLDAGFRRGSSPLPDIQMASIKMPSLISSANAAEMPPAPVKEPHVKKQRVSATTTSAPPVQRMISAATGKDAWAVQVGAFAIPSQAQQQLTLAAKAAPSLLKDQDRAVVPVKSGKKEYHRARFVSMSEAEARQACKVLGKAGVECAVLPPSAARL
jgi:D-alanyl-D-alanine carboxypeptidase